MNSFYIPVLKQSADFYRQQDLPDPIFLLYFDVSANGNLIINFTTNPNSNNYSTYSKEDTIVNMRSDFDSLGITFISFDNDVLPIFVIKLVNA